MGRRSSRGRLGTRVDAAFDTVGLTILPGVEMPEWAQALMDEPHPAAPQPIADQQEALQPATMAQPSPAHPQPHAWAAAPEPFAAPEQPEATQSAAPVAALVGAASGAGARAGTLAPPAPSAPPAPPTPPGPSAPQPPGTGYEEQPAQAWASPESAAARSAVGEHHEFSDEQVALLSWWADTIAAGSAVPPAVPPAVPSAPEAPPARRGRAAVRWVLIAALLALAALAAALVAGPKLWDRAASAPAEASAAVALPDSVAGLVTITDAQIADGMRPLINYGLRPAGLIVTRAYGEAETGPVAVAAMATAMDAPGDAASQIEGWAQRTGSVVDEPVAGDGASADVLCAAALGTETVPTGAFCVWTDGGVRGQIYAADVSAKKALQLTAEVRSGTTS